MKERYPINQNLEINQLKPSQETHLLKDSYINHDVLSSHTLSLHFTLARQIQIQ